MTEKQALKAIRKAASKVSRLECAYGSSTVPVTSPSYPAIESARRAYAAAMAAWRETVTA